MEKPKFLLEIDDKRIEFTGVYDDDDVFSQAGYLFGSDQNTHPEDKVIGFKKNNCVAVVGVYRENPDGSIWGIKGIFRKGQWAVGENDMPLFRVWDRLA